MFRDEVAQNRVVVMHDTRQRGSAPVPAVAKGSVVAVRRATGMQTSRFQKKRKVLAILEEDILLSEARRSVTVSKVGSPGQVSDVPLNKLYVY